MIRFNSKIWLYLGALVVLYTGVVAGISYWKGEQNVRNKMQAALIEGRIKIIEQVNEADEQINPDSDDAICAILGGCLPID